MVKMKNKILFLLFTFYCSLNINAQCAMCRAVLESEGSQSTAEGINDGIMFLMAVPYILVGTMGYFIYRKYNKPQKSESTDEIL
jgi:hypothetical protein